MARGAGVTRIRTAQPGKPLPEGREPGDARGLTWPVLLGVVGISFALIIAAFLLGSVLLYLNDKPIGPWAKEVTPYAVTLMAALLTLLLTKVLNNDGRGLRNQQTLAANQEAVHSLLRRTADNQIELSRQVQALKERLDEREDADLRRELREAVEAVRSVGEETGARLGRVVRAITGQQHAVPTRQEPEPPRRASSTALSTDPPLADPRARASDPRQQDPFDTSRPWHTGTTGVQPAVDDDTDPPPWRPYGR